MDVSYHTMKYTTLQIQMQKTFEIVLCFKQDTLVSVVIKDFDCLIIL